MVKKKPNGRDEHQKSCCSYEGHEGQSFFRSGMFLGSLIGRSPFFFGRSRRFLNLQGYSVLIELGLADILEDDAVLIEVCLSSRLVRHAFFLFAEYLIDLLAECLGGEGFDEIVAHTGFHRLYDVLLLSLGRNHQKRYVFEGVVGTDSL